MLLREFRQHSAPVAPEQAEKSMTPVLPSQHVQLKDLPAAIYPERDSHMLGCDNIETRRHKLLEQHQKLAP